MRMHIDPPRHHQQPSRVHAPHAPSTSSPAPTAAILSPSNKTSTRTRPPALTTTVPPRIRDPHSLLSPRPSSCSCFSGCHSRRDTCVCLCCCLFYAVFRKQSEGPPVSLLATLSVIPRRESFALCTCFPSVFCCETSASTGQTSAAKDCTPRNAPHPPDGHPLQRRPQNP